MPHTTIARAASRAAREISERISRRIPAPSTGYRIFTPGGAARAIRQGQISPYISENNVLGFLRNGYLSDDGNIIATYTSHDLEEAAPTRYVYREPISLYDPGLRVSYRDSDGDHINVPITEDLVRRGEAQLQEKLGNDPNNSGEVPVHRSMSQGEVRDILSGQDSEPIFMTRFRPGLFSGTDRIIVSTPRIPESVTFGGTHVDPREIIRHPHSSISYNRPDGSRYDGPITEEQIESFRAKENPRTPEQRILRDLSEMDSAPIEEVATTTSERDELVDL